MRFMFYLSVFLMLGLAACESDASANSSLPRPEDVGNPAAGEALFNTPQGDAHACSFCHYTDKEQTRFAPSLKGIADRAGSRVEGLSAVEYLRQSIVEPDAFIADEKKPGRMYQHFGEILTEQQINDLVAYLLTLD